MIQTANRPLLGNRPGDAIEATTISLLGVDYLRLTLPDGGELYLTCFGRRLGEHLAPGNWYAPDWFQSNRVRLRGTSAIYKLPTRPLRGRSVDLVVRFSRVGQELPVDEATLGENTQTEFNTCLKFFLLSCLR